MATSLRHSGFQDWFVNWCGLAGGLAFEFSRHGCSALGSSFWFGLFESCFDSCSCQGPLQSLPWCSFKTKFRFRPPPESAKIEGIDFALAFGETHLMWAYEGLGPQACGHAGGEIMLGGLLYTGRGGVRTCCKQLRNHVGQQADRLPQ